MTDTIIPTGDLSEAREFIARLRREIEERQQAYHEKVQRIRQRAKADEYYEQERFYLETEQLRRQMEALIQNVADYESIQKPSPTIVR